MKILKTVYFFMLGLLKITVTSIVNRWHKARTGLPHPKMVFYKALGLYILYKNNKKLNSFSSRAEAKRVMSICFHYYFLYENHKEWKIKAEELIRAIAIARNDTCQNIVNAIKKMESYR